MLRRPKPFAHSGTISAIVVALVLAITITIEVLLVRMLYLNWRVFRDTDVDASVSRSLLVRIAIFGFFQLAALGCVLNDPGSRQRMLIAHAQLFRRVRPPGHQYGAERPTCD